MFDYYMSIHLILKQQSQSPMITNEIHQLTYSIQKEGDQTIQSIFKNKFNIYLKHKSSIQSYFHLEQKELLQPFLYTWNNGGKKIRIIISILINQLFQSEINEDIIKVGGLIQTLHCASLIIDDIQDGSIQRRGKECTHLIYGTDCSINAANLIYFLAPQQFFSEIRNPEDKLQLMNIYFKQMTSLHIGQGIDIKNHKATSQSELSSCEEYIKLIRLKTGGLFNMLIEMIGVILKLQESKLKLLINLMTHIGIAFQIIDDILNLQNVQEKMGKGVIAEDFHERKISLIVDELRNNKQFLELFFLRQKNEEVIKKMLKIVTQSGVLQRCKAKAQQFITEAKNNLQQLECPNSKSTFKKFIQYIFKRQT